MLTNVAVMADLVIIPIISNLYRTFPDQMSIVNYIVSGPMLVIVGASLLATVLLKKLSKKTVIVIGGIVFAMGALFGVLIENAIFMAVMRSLVGIGAGFVNVVAVSLIADIYEDENTRAKITGYYNASMSFIGMTFSYVSGILAQAGVWRNSFKCYWVAVPMAFMLILFIPSIKMTDNIVERRERAVTTIKESFGWRYWFMAISWFVMNVIFGATVLYYLSAYIVENSLGDSAFTGLAASVKSIVGFLIGLGFGFIYSKIKRQTNAICCLVSAVCLFIMIISPSKFSALVLATIAGCAYKVAFSYAYVHGFEIVPISRIDDAVAVTTAVYGIGSFISTYFVTLLMKIMNTEVVTKTFIVSAVIFVILAFIEILISIKEKRELAAV
jgi:MFS family permease